jgi:hypothetical protein
VGLLLGCPLAAWLALQAPDAGSANQTPGEMGKLSFPPGEIREFRPSPVRTDKGRPVAIGTLIPARRLAPEVLHERQSQMLRSLGLSERVITLPDVDRGCNCFGWVFAGGRYWLCEDDMEAILKDNGYHQMNTARVGDVVIYRDGAGAVVHAGLVRAAGEDGLLLVESKWGEFGRFIHPPSAHPFGACTWSYHRSARVGHLLRGLALAALN